MHKKTTSRSGQEYSGGPTLPTSALGTNLADMGMLYRQINHRTSVPPWVKLYGTSGKDGNIEYGNIDGRKR